MVRPAGVFSSTLRAPSSLDGNCGALFVASSIVTSASFPPA